MLSLPARRCPLLPRLRPRGAFSREIAGGVLCVATMFASVSALNQPGRAKFAISSRRAAHGAHSRRRYVSRQGAG